MQQRTSHILHIYPTFEVGGAQLRIARVINHFGGRFAHTIVSLNGDLSCRSHIDPAIDVTFTDSAASGRALPGRIWAYRREIADLSPDVIVTNNWGSIEWAMAARLGSHFRHIHCESGFGPDEATRTLTRRNWLRRIALSRTSAVVMPSHTLERIATEEWRLPRSKLRVVRDGIDCELFKNAPAGQLAGFARREGEIVIGTLAVLRPEKNLRRLIRCFAAVCEGENMRLVIAGDGRERHALEAAAQDANLGERVVFTGFLDKPETAFANFDVFALSSDTEQTPNAVIQAMAAGLPVAALDVGDLKTMLPRENAERVVARGDEGGFTDLLRTLAEDPQLRARLGAANQKFAFDRFDEAQMFSSYEALLSP